MMETQEKTYQDMSQKYEHPNLQLQLHASDPDQFKFVSPWLNFFATKKRSER